MPNRRTTRVFTAGCAALLAACSVSVGGGSAPDPADQSVPDHRVTWAATCGAAYERAVGRGGQSAKGIPWITLYDDAGEPLLHQIGMRSNSVRTWGRAVDRREPRVDGPAYADIQPFIGGLPLPDADVVAVKYSADWCTPCKNQSVALQAFKDARPDLAIAHVEIDVDAVIKGRERGDCPV